MVPFIWYLTIRVIFVLIFSHMSTALLDYNILQGQEDSACSDTVIPGYLWGYWFQDTSPPPSPNSDNKRWKCSSSLYKIVWYLQWTNAHPLIYFKSSLDYLRYLIQHKCYVNCCWYVANSSFAVWTFLEFFPLSIFTPKLVESEDAEPTDTESQLYLAVYTFKHLLKSVMPVWIRSHSKGFFKWFGFF